MQIACQITKADWVQNIITSEANYKNRPLMHLIVIYQQWNHSLMCFGMPVLEIDRDQITW